MILNNLKHWFLKFFLAFDRYIASFLIWLLIQTRPLLGTMDICPFQIGCTNYAIIQLDNSIVPVAIWHTLRRLLRCNPIWLWWYKKQALL